MAHTLIVEKALNRVMFVRDSAVALYVDDVWDAVAFYKTLWLAGVSPEFLAAPWNFALVNNGLVVAPCSETQRRVCEANNLRAQLFQVLGRAIDRHRGVGHKQALHQEQVYAIKADQARRYLAYPDIPDGVARSTYPFVVQDAEIDGLSWKQAAQAIVFRATQRQDILLVTEQMRRTFTKRILEAQPEQIEPLRQELLTYERQG